MRTVCHPGVGRREVHLDPHVYRPRAPASCTQDWMPPLEEPVGSTAVPSGISNISNVQSYRAQDQHFDLEKYQSRELFPDSCRRGGKGEREENC